MLEEIITAYNEAVFDTDRELALAVIHDAVQQRGVSPEEVVFKIVIPAIEQMVKSISEDFDTNLAQHFMTSQIAAEVVEEMIPRFKEKPSVVGRIVIGTAEGDLHSLGKRIVTGCLKAMMIEAIDLGVNVAPQRFVEAAIEHDVQVIGISAMMAHTARGDNGCLKVRQILQERGLDRRFRIIVGGAPYRFEPELYKRVGADAWALDGITAGKVITELIREAQS